VGRAAGQDRAEIPPVRRISRQGLEFAQDQTGAEPRFNGTGDKGLIRRCERPLRRSRVRSSHTRRIIQSDLTVCHEHSVNLSPWAGVVNKWYGPARPE
jgi:hypothetical protein